MLDGGRRIPTDVARGLWAALRNRPKTFGGIVLAMIGLQVLLPPLVLSLARRPVDYFTFNPWLGRLPDYVASPEFPLAEKVTKVWALALFWFSADGPMGVDWGFVVDVRDAARILLVATLFGGYFALWLFRGPAGAPPRVAAPSQRAGVLGAFVSTLGLSTGPCSVMGCGAPVLPVLGLAIVGASSGTLTLLASLSTIATTTVVAIMTLAVGYRAWQVGRRSGATGPPSVPR